MMKNLTNDFKFAFKKINFNYLKCFQNHQLLEKLNKNMIKTMNELMKMLSDLFNKINIINLENENENNAEIKYTFKLMLTQSVIINVKNEI